MKRSNVNSFFRFFAYMPKPIIKGLKVASIIVALLGLILAASETNPPNPLITLKHGLAGLFIFTSGCWLVKFFDGKLNKDA